MKILIQSAALDSIRWALEAGFADGVFVTPAVLDADAFGVDLPAQIEMIARLGTGQIFATVGAVAADDVHRDGRELSRIADHVVIAVPFVEDGATALRRLASEGIRTAATYVVSPAQAVLAAKAGAEHVCVAVDQLDAHGHDASQVLREIRVLFDRHGAECDLVAVVGDSARLVTTSFVDGADTVAVPAPTLRALVQHPLTDRSLDHLLADISRRPRPRAPV
jgi:transaldolase